MAITIMLQIHTVPSKTQALVEPQSTIPTISGRYRPREYVPYVASRGNVMRVVATAYTNYDPGMPGHGITASGAKTKEFHTIAVDPKIIPLGSWVYISIFKEAPNKGWFKAEDTGGAIKGKRIDIYMEVRKEALEFGVQPLTIVVLPKSNE